ncbi:phenylalanine--tRNA ligase subunit beta [Quaeritorhiza haematococci]|nr:phenylalanine--tRNA ligase subunit beta [Quaeritorhiza haematococci]
MPVVSIDKETFFEEVGRTFTTEEFEELCFEFGIELEDDTTEKEMASKDGNAEKAKDLSDRGIYRIDIPANRADLLCVEGLSRAIKAYLGKQKTITYKCVAPKNGQYQQLHVKAETSSVRPYVVAAILRDITFTQLRYESFIDLQDKLHNNICRKRTLVAIGTHDLETIQGPFSYEALPPKDIKFVPLNQTKEMNAEDLMTFYESDRKLSKFLHIIRDKPRYPVIYDKNRVVLSLPPIINGDHSKIKLDTKNVFIECTATDLTKAKTVLNTVVTMFSQHCTEKFTVEPVEVIQADGTKTLYPDLSPREVDVEINYINKAVGVKLEADEICRLLSKMMLTARYTKDRRLVKVQIPPTRSDVLHPCDIMEDVAIAYGFNNIPKTNPKTNTVGKPYPINKLTDLLRKEISLAGYTEILSLILCSHDENFAHMRKEDTGKLAVKLANPKTVEYQVVRTSLLPGILKTIKENKRMPIPIKVFEVSDVVFKHEPSVGRSRNQRNLGAVICGKTSGFELIHGLLDRVMMMLNIPLVETGNKEGYYIKEADDPTFFPGRCANVYYKNKHIGVFGILHPLVLEKFEIGYPCSALELNVEPFL